jgi:hypothetical protein
MDTPEFLTFLPTVHMLQQRITTDVYGPLLVLLLFTRHIKA